MKTGTQDKKGEIVSSALRRFSHFGFHKTTLAEIAEDSSISKQALAYYFPDKSTLANAVEDTIMNEYVSTLSQELIISGSTLEGMLKLTEVKRSFLQKYFMLIADDHPTEFAGNRLLTWKQKIRKEELRLLQPLLQHGINTGELMAFEVGKKSELFLDVLSALSRCVHDKPFPDATAFDELFLKQKEVTEIFYNGLKVTSWKN